MYNSPVQRPRERTNQITQRLTVSQSANPFLSLIVALLVPEDVLRLQKCVRDEPGLHRPETGIPHRQKHPSYRHDIPWWYEEVGREVAAGKSSVTYFELLIAVGIAHTAMAASAND